MSLAKHHRDWEDMAALDPMWAVLSEPERRNGGWSPDEFFSTGANETARLRGKLLDLGLPDRFESALDFGCGLGDRKSTRLNSSHANISYAVFCLKKTREADTHPHCGAVVSLACALRPRVDVL